LSWQLIASGASFLTLSRLIYQKAHSRNRRIWFSFRYLRIWTSISSSAIRAVQGQVCLQWEFFFVCKRPRLDGKSTASWIQQPYNCWPFSLSEAELETRPGKSNIGPLYVWIHVQVLAGSSLSLPSESSYCSDNGIIVVRIGLQANWDISLCIQKALCLCSCTSLLLETALTWSIQQTLLTRQNHSRLSASELHLRLAAQIPMLIFKAEANLSYHLKQAYLSNNRAAGCIPYHWPGAS
jgi:hypothetical protein